MTIATITSDLIDRKTASRLLKTSIRTIDRYRQSGKLSTTIIDNRIYVKKEEIQDFVARQGRQRQKTYVSTKTRVDRDEAPEDNGQDTARDTMDSQNERTASSSGIHGRHDRDIHLDEYYKKMVDDLMQNIHEKEEKLESANYQIGKLEAQLRLSVPLGEFQKEKKQLLLQSGELQKTALQKEAALKKLQKDFFLERLNKRVYLLIAMGLILLQPLLLLLIS